MKTKTGILTALLSLLVIINSVAQVKKPFRLSSPDKRTVMEVGSDKQGELRYRVLYGKQEAIAWSDLGLDVKGHSAGEIKAIKEIKRDSRSETFAWPLGENDSITNNYNELLLTYTDASLLFNLNIRVFNGSVAFRYEIPQQTAFQSNGITKERTTFQLTKPGIMYQYNQESIFTPTAIDTLSKTCDFPATIHAGKLYLSIGEADNRGYTKAELVKGNASNSLAVAFPRDKEVRTGDSFQSPWRTISIAQTAIGLHDYSELNLKLTQTDVKEVPGWINPGKLIRAQLTTQSGVECIDFAVKNNLQYIMFDAGWYGAEFRSTSDPTQVIPQIDMPKVIQYGKEKGIGVILYVNYVGLKAKLDTILPLFKHWGVSGMKFGFVDGLTQDGLTWLVSAIRKANDYGFVIDIHDNYKPTGLSRTYPALLTQEGIRGDENSPDAFHTTVLPFTRFLAGPADFTFCYPNTSNKYSKNLKVSNAQQLALTVVYFSPLQALFWYGKPTEYTNEGEIEFFKYVPTVWNESHYLCGEIGKNISVARRKGDTWFVGNVAGLEEWNSRVQLDFLTKGKAYTATVYEDDGAGSIRKRTEQVRKGESLPFEIKAKGGQAIIIRPAN